MGRQLITSPVQDVIYTLAMAKLPDTKTKVGMLRE